ncbi:MAG: DUF167 domain-containing protein [Gaiella sp.]
MSSTSTRTRLRLRVAPGARTTGVVGRYGEGWKVRVAAAPAEGRANEAVVALIAHELALRRTAVRIVSGHSGRDKVVELTGLGPAEVERRLASVGKEHA